MKILQFNLIVSAILIFTLDASKADTFQPTRFDDPTPDGCQLVDCSLREAVLAANDLAGDDEIILVAGRYEIEISADENNENTTGDFDVSSDQLTITGKGSWNTTVDADFKDRVFDVVNAHLVLEKVNLKNGLVLDTGDGGGGIRVIAGNLTLKSVVLQDHFSDLFGGAIYMAPVLPPGSAAVELMVLNSVIKSNKAASQGGAISCFGCDFYISDSEIYWNDSNTRHIEIGGLGLGSGVLQRTSIHDNFANLGPVLYVSNENELELISNTISNNLNKSSFAFNVIELVGINSIDIIGNTIAENSTDAIDLFFNNSNIHTFSDNIIDQSCLISLMNTTGFNLFNESCLFQLSPTDVVLDEGELPGLEPLAFNGGIGLMHKLSTDSLANKLRNESCDLVDQRGFHRSGFSCDVGSVQTGYCSSNQLLIEDNTTVISELIVSEELGNLLELELFLDIGHSRVGDLEIRLENIGSGTEVVLLSQPELGACSGIDLKKIISESSLDEISIQQDCISSGNFNFQAYPQLVPKFKPITGSLNQFIGEDLYGPWRLKITDHVSGSTGQLNQWCLLPDYQPADLIFASGFD